MKIQVIAILSADGYLLPADTLQGRRLSPHKYSPDAFRERTDLPLYRDSPLISLLAERRDSSDTTYTVDASSETSDFIRGLLLYDLVDEWVVYELKEEQKSGLAFSGLFCPDGWDIHGEHLLSPDTVCRIYRRKGL